MKKYISLFLLLIMVSGATANANPYILLDGGGGGAAKAGSIGFGFGGTQAIQNKYPLEFDFSFAFTNDTPGDLLDYPVPHTDFRLLGEKKKDNEYGLLFKTGLPIAEKLWLMGGAGVSFQELVLVAQSNVTGWLYTESSKTQSYFVGYGGILYKADRMVLSVGYENRRGVVGGIGFTW